MNNNYFNINEYRCNTVMHCRTVEEIKILFDYLKAVDHPWCPSYNKENAYAIAEKVYSTYRENTCIGVKFCGFASIDFYEKRNCVILEFENFDWFNLNDIKDGMLVVTSDGEKYVKLSHFLVGESSCIPLSAYDYFLCNTDNRCKDIVAVYSSDVLYPYRGIKELFLSYRCDTGYVQSYCVYEKYVVPRKLTVKQIEEKLGYPVEIVQE